MGIGSRLLVGATTILDDTLQLKNGRIYSSTTYPKVCAFTNNDTTNIRNFYVTCDSKWTTRIEGYKYYKKIKVNSTLAKVSVTLSLDDFNVYNPTSSSSMGTVSIKVFEGTNATAQVGYTYSTQYSVGKGTMAETEAGQRFDFWQGNLTANAQYNVEVTIEFMDGSHSGCKPDGRDSIGVKSSAPNSGTIAIGKCDEVYVGNTAIGCSNTYNFPARRVTIGADGIAMSYLTGAQSGWTNASDYRDKTDFKSISNSLKFINLLNPVTFVDNQREKYTSFKDTGVLDDNGKMITEKIFNDIDHMNGTLKGDRRISGFIAQDVYKAMIDIYNDDNYACIVDYNMYDNDIEDNNDIEPDRYYMRYTQLIPFLTGAIQELSKEIDALKATIAELKSQSINQ